MPKNTRLGAGRKAENTHRTGACEISDFRLRRHWALQHLLQWNTTEQI